MALRSQICGWRIHCRPPRTVSKDLYYFIHILTRIYTRTILNVTLSWEEGTSKIAVASGDGEAIVSFLGQQSPTLLSSKVFAIDIFSFLVLSFSRSSSFRSISSDPTPEEHTANPIPPSNSTQDNSFESDTSTLTGGGSPVKFKVWFDYKGSSAAMISHALERAMEVDFTALKKTSHEISFVLDPTPVNGFWSHQT